MLFLAFAVLIFGNKPMQETAIGGVLWINVFLKILQNLQEMTCARASFLIKLQASGLLKKRLRFRCFPVNFTKFFKIPILQSTFEQLLLSILDQCCTNRLICSAWVNLIYFAWVNFQHVWVIMWETNKRVTKTHKYDQKQPPEVFFKKMCS